MDIKILEEKDVPLLNRKEYILEVDYAEKTPSNESLKTELVSKFNTKQELIAIKQIRQLFGIRRARAKVNVYKDEKSLKETENRQKTRKKEKVKKEAKPKQEKK